MIKIAIVCVSGEMIHADTAWCIAQNMTNIGPDFPTMIINPKLASIPMARYIGVRQAVNAYASHVLFVDSDMVFPDNSLRVLLEYDKAIVGVTYSKRQEGSEQVGKINDKALITPARLRSAEHLGMGLMLIETNVFNRIPQPYFKVTFNNGNFETEDQYFCRKAQEDGLTIWCDVELSKHVKHIGVKHYALDI